VGAPGARPEIYAYGFRNPWKFSFDRMSGELYLSDVGNDRWEEVNRVVPGGNYGWPAMEGSECFTFYDTFLPFDPECPESGRFALPLWAYTHLDRDPEGGNAITGGYVYRGEAHPAWQGLYFFGDFVSGRIWTLDVETPGAEAQLWLDTPYAISSFVEDAAGELYILTIDGGLYRLAE
jgi:glucose/arabinose dehydrogenase